MKAVVKIKAFLIALGKAMTSRGLILVSALLIASSSVNAADMNGCWTDEIGATYYVTNVKNEVWWLGESSPSYPTFVNMAHGKLDGNTLILTWADVPKGLTHSSGTLVLAVSSAGEDMTMTAVRKTGGYGPSRWEKVVGNCP